MDGKTLGLQMQISSALTLFGSITVLVTYWKTPELRKLVYVRLVVNAILCSGCAAVAFIEGPHLNNESFACWFQGIVANYFVLASVMWTVAIAHMLHVLVHDLTIMDVFLRSYHVICWGLPLVLTLLPLTTNDYGRYRDQGLCTFSNRSNSPAWGITVWTFAALYAWIWVGILAIGVLLCTTMMRLRSQSHGAGSVVTSQVYLMAFYPVTLVLCWSFHTVHRLQEQFGHHSPPAWTIVIGNCLPILQGAIYAIVLFGTNIDFRSSFCALLGLRPRPSGDEGVALSSVVAQQQSDGPIERSESPGAPTPRGTMAGVEHLILPGKPVERARSGRFDVGFGYEGRLSLASDAGAFPDVL